MSEPVQRVWMDVSMLARCGTQPTGILRVLLAILNEWRRGVFADIRLCQFNDAAGGYVEVDPTILDRFQTKPTVDTAPPAAPRASRLQRFRAIAKQIVKPLVSWMPTSVKRLIKRKAKGYAHIAKDVAKVPLKALRNWLRLTPIPSPLALGPGDLVLSLGEDWNFGNRSALIYRLKKQHGFRTAWLIHDLIPILYPQFFGPGLPERFTPWLVDTLWSADMLFANSENTRADILRYCLRGGIPTPPVEVIRYGENLPTGEAKAPKVLEDSASRLFALCVGTVEVRKNQLLLYHVWRKLLQKYGPEKTPQLVIVGMRGWMGGNTMHLAEVDPVTKDHVRFLAKCNDAELGWLYQNCAFTLYPSYYEGWGLPVAESLIYGKHCIASNQSSIPEIGGDLVIMHDPSSVDACLACMEQALDPVYRAGREARIRSHYRRHEWSECATQMAEMIQRHFGVSTGAASKLAA